jgi:uncharacterized protein YrzB (UPF0473 family)
MNEFNEIDDQKIITTINGEEKECDLLFTYDADELNETIIGYTDNTYDENNKLNIYVSKYTMMNPSQFITVDDPEELALVQDVINDIQEHYK